MSKYLNHKFLPIILTFLFCSALVACGGSGEESSTSPPTPAPEPTPEPTPEPEPEPPPHSRLPVVVNGRASLYAGSLEDNPSTACGRVDSTDPLESRFGRGANSMVAAPDGSLYLTDYPCNTPPFTHAIRKIDANGVVTTMATSAWDPQESSPLTSFVLPNGIAVDHENNIYVSDARDPKGSMIEAHCQDGEFPSGPGPFPRGRRSGIWKISPNSDISIFAGVYGQPEDQPFTADGRGPLANFTYPGPLAFSSDGVLHLIDDIASLGSYRTIDTNAVVTTSTSSYFPLVVASPQGEIFATTNCRYRPDAMSDLVNVTTGEIAAVDVPNPLMIAIDSAGNVFSTSPPRYDAPMTIYRKKAGENDFLPVVTNVYQPRAMAMGPDDALYIKSVYAVIKIKFN